jgi:four helix bundle protein
MKDNLIKTKSYAFALRIIKLYKYLCEEQKEFILSKQILRCGTSIGANIEEASAGQSRRDFIAKLQISLKEAKETHYWIRLLKDADFVAENLALSFLDDCQEIIAILTAILKSTKIESDNS